MIDNLTDLSEWKSKDRVNPDNDNDYLHKKVDGSGLNDANSLNEDIDEQINFINFTQEYCVGFIDVINSTMDTATIKDPKKIRKYYSLFLNSMSSIIRQYNGKIIKNSGDNIFFYFPKTSKSNDENCFKEAFECCYTMIKSNSALNAELLQDNLPAINYRISMDYGIVEVALSSNRNEVDLFGSVVNECAKINRMSKSNELVIGESLYKLLIKYSFSKDFEIKQIKFPDENINKYGYNIYSISKNSMMATTIDKNNSRHNLLSSPSSNFDLLNKVRNESHHILIIDDDKDILYTFSLLLKRNGYDVYSYSNPAEALKHLMEVPVHNYDLVLMDIRMPDISGIKLFYWFKAIDPYMNILLVTALDLIGELVDALPGISETEILKKPISNDDLLSKIQKKLSK